MWTQYCTCALQCLFYLWVIFKVLCLINQDLYGLAYRFLRDKSFLWRIEVIENKKTIGNTLPHLKYSDPLPEIKVYSWDYNLSRFLDQSIKIEIAIDTYKHRRKCSRRTFSRHLGSIILISHYLGKVVTTCSLSRCITQPHKNLTPVYDFISGSV